MVVDHYRGRIEAVADFHRAFDVAGENRGLERGRQCIRPVQRVFQLEPRIDADHRAEHLIGHQSAFPRCVEDHGRRIQRVRQFFAAGQQLSAAVDGFSHPFVDPVELGGPDQRADIGLFVHRIADR